MQGRELELGFAATPHRHLHQQQGADVGRPLPEQDRRPQHADGPGQQPLQTWQGARIRTGQQQQQPQQLQRNGPEGHELEPEQGLAAGVHRAQVLRVRRWVTSL